jgi:chemotaxis protein CheD
MSQHTRTGPFAHLASAATGVADVEEPEETMAEGRTPRLVVYLLPGRVFISREPSIVRMVLGSCVAVCAWDPYAEVGGANHFLLPHTFTTGQPSPRFGNVAIQQLLDQLLASGASRRNLKAKLFGGSCVLQAFQGREEHLGSQNVLAARAQLEGEGIPVVAEDVGGNSGRRVIFQTDDGSAWTRRL